MRPTVPEPSAGKRRRGSQQRRTAGGSGGRAAPVDGGTEPDLAHTQELVRSYDAEILVAGGIRDLDGLRRLRDTGVTGVILGEVLLSGAIDYHAAVEAAA